MDLRGQRGSANRKLQISKLQIRKMSHLRKVRISNKLFKSANLQFCDLRSFFADRPSLPVTELFYRDISRNMMRSTRKQVGHVLPFHFSQMNAFSGALQRVEE